MSVQERYDNPKVETLEKLSSNARMGKKLRHLRTRDRISQEALALAIGVTYQQIQKYEAGTNKLSFTKLHAICTFFSVGYDYFLGEPAGYMVEGIQSRTTMEMLDAFNRITDGKTRRALITMAEKLADKE